MCLALNDNQSEDKSSESNKSLNKVQNVLAYFGKQSKKLITKVKTQIKKTSPENTETMLICQGKKVIKNVYYKRQFFVILNLVTIVNVPIKHI